MQNATIIVDKMLAQKCMQKEEIRIEPTMCQILERTDVIKCYKYWRYGYLAINCTNQNRETLCNNCGKIGH